MNNEDLKYAQGRYSSYVEEALKGEPDSDGGYPLSPDGKAWMNLSRTYQAQRRTEYKAAKAAALAAVEAQFGIA